MEKSTMEILLIEDNYDEADLAIRNLQKNNLSNRVIHINDGKDALDFIFSKGRFWNSIFSLPDLILLDLNLPGAHGLEILRQVKSDVRTQGIPVIMLTGSQDENDIFESKKLGASNYLTKPIHFDSFFKAVTEIGLCWKIIE